VKTIDKTCFLANKNKENAIRLIDADALLEKLEAEKNARFMYSDAITNTYLRENVAGIATGVGVAQQIVASMADGK